LFGDLPHPNDNMSGEEDNFFFEGVECVRLLAARLTRARAHARLSAPAACVCLFRLR